MVDEVEGAEANGPKEPSVIIVLGLVAVLTLVAAGSGIGLGMMMAGDETIALDEATSQAEAKSEEEKPEYSSGEHVQMLHPVVTNLLAPRGVYIRLEGAVVFASKPAKNDEALISRLSQDVVSLLRTMTLAQIEGPSGLLHLREDLNARVRIRSGGDATEIVLHTLVVE